MRRSIWLLALLLVLGCAPLPSIEEEPEEAAYTTFSVLFGETPGEEMFFPQWEGEQVKVWAAVHALDEELARELGTQLEEEWMAALPLLEAAAGQKLQLLVTYLPSKTLGYTPLPPEGEPQIILSALRPEAMAYTLCHEYQHVCAWYACDAGGVTLSEAADEALSAAFCEQMLPGKGKELGILDEARECSARELLALIGEEGVASVHRELSQGHTQEDIWQDLFGID